MKRGFGICFILLFFCVYLHLNPSSESLRALFDICELYGYTMIACTSVRGEFSGESGDIVRLYNGWIFELTTSAYNYSYSPNVGVFAKELKIANNPLLIYKLVVEDEIYDAIRIR